MSVMEAKKKVEYVHKVFNHVLLNTEDGDDATAYLRERGFTTETIESFGFGRTPKKNAIAEYFRKKEASNFQSLHDLGIVRIKDTGEVEDFFKGRLMIPIHDDNGSIVGFAGRTLPHNTHPAKYLNSPESELFKKRNVLFNFHKAKDHIKKSGYAFLMEGYLDVAMAVQHNVNNVVGTMGTSLTIENIMKLKQITENIIIMFDGDKAGMESAIRNADLLLENGFDVRIAYIPNGLDPHELLLQYGIDGMKQVCQDYVYNYFDFTMAYLNIKYNLSVEADRMMYIQQVLDSLKHETIEKQREIFTNLSISFGFNYDLANYHLNFVQKV